jgi:hypothetical protein
MDDKIRGLFSTASGMLALWEPGHFQQITDYLSWESELCEDEDILRHIQEGAFVPLNIQADGAFECEVRVGNVERPSAISSRELPYLTVSSEPYFFRSRGRLAISGLEHIGAEPGKAAAFLALGIGDWAVTVHLIEWTSEPGALGEDGKPTPSAMADFVVLLNPASPGASAGTQYRTKVNTFERPE